MNGRCDAESPYPPNHTLCPPDVWRSSQTIATRCSDFVQHAMEHRICAQNDGPVVGIVGVTSNYHIKEGYYTTIGAWNWGAAAWFTPPNWRGVIWGDEDEEDNTALGITIHYAYNSTT